MIDKQYKRQPEIHLMIPTASLACRLLKRPLNNYSKLTNHNAKLKFFNARVKNFNKRVRPEKQESI